MLTFITLIRFDYYHKERECFVSKECHGLQGAEHNYNIEVPSMFMATFEVDGSWHTNWHCVQSECHTNKSKGLAHFGKFTFQALPNLNHPSIIYMNFKTLFDV